MGRRWVNRFTPFGEIGNLYSSGVEGIKLPGHLLVGSRQPVLLFRCQEFSVVLKFSSAQEHIEMLYAAGVRETHISLIGGKQRCQLFRVHEESRLVNQSAQPGWRRETPESHNITIPKIS